MALKTDDVKKWLARIELSKKWREPQEKKWKRYKDYLQNIYYDSADMNQDNISVNLVFPMVRVIIPSIYSRNPDVMVIPRKGPAFQDNAQAMYQFLKYIIKEIDLKTEVKLTILDAIIYGHGWCKQGYESEFAETEPDGEEGTSIFDVVKSMAKNMFSSDDGTDSEVEPQEEEYNYALRPNEKLVAERPWALRVSPDDMFVPAFTRTPNIMPWIAQRFILPTEDIKNNPRFKNTKDLKPSRNIQELLGRSDYMNSLTPSDTEYTVLYEIHDGRENMIYTLADSNDKPLEEKENEYTEILQGRYQFEMLRFNEVPDEFYPTSDIEPWEPQIVELNRIRTQQSIHRKRFNRRYITKRDSFTAEDLDDLKNGEDGTIVQTDEENLTNAILPIEDATLSQDVYQTEGRIKDDVTEISGITGYQRGSVSQGAKTATEASIVESQSRSRVDERLDVVNTFVLRVIGNVADISQAFMTQEEVAPIIGDDLVPSWVTITPDQIKGDFLYDIVYGSSLPINKDVDRQQFLQLYEMAANDPYYNPVKFRTELLRKFDIRDVDSYLAPGVATQNQPINANPGEMPPPPGGPDGGVGPMPPPPISIPTPVSPQGGPVPTSASIRASIARSIGPTVPGATGGKLQ